MVSGCPLRLNEWRKTVARKLISSEVDSISPDSQSLPTLQSLAGGIPCSKSSAKTAVVWMFTRPGSMPVSASPMQIPAPSTFRLASRPFPRACQELPRAYKYNCKEVCMESAGKFWIPVFNILEKTCLVTLAHPKYTKPQKGNKTDRKDAKWICDLFMCDMIKPSFIPAASHSPSARPRSLPRQADEYADRREEPCSELPHRIQPQTG